MRVADMRRFYHFHDHWLRRLLTEDRSREIGVCLLGIVGTRNDDHLGITYVWSPLMKRLTFGCDTDTVLQDAFSSKYKSALYSGVFENAVKKYRQKAKTQGEKKTQEEDNKDLVIPVRIRSSLVEKSSARAQRSLETLPGKVLEQAIVFHRYIQYLAHAEHGAIVPTDLKSMLDDISRSEKLDDRMKDEILQDEEAKHVSMSLRLIMTPI